MFYVILDAPLIFVTNVERSTEVLEFWAIITAGTVFLAASSTYYQKNQWQELL